MIVYGYQRRSIIRRRHRFKSWVYIQRIIINVLWKPLDCGCLFKLMLRYSINNQGLCFRLVAVLYEWWADNILRVTASVACGGGGKISAGISKLFPVSCPRIIRFK